VALLVLVAICSAQQIRFLHAFTGANSNVDVTFSFTNLFTNVAYGTLTDYTNIAVNTYVVTVRSAGTTTTVASLPNVIIAALNTYTLIAFGDSLVTLTILIDTINRDPTTPLVRASHFSTSASLQTVLFNNIPFGQPPAAPNPIAFGQSTGYARIGATNGTLVYNNAGTVTKSLDFSGQNGQAYDVFFYGSTTNTDKPLTLRLVQNMAPATPTPIPTPTLPSLPSLPSFSLPSSVPRLFKKRN